MDNGDTQNIEPIAEAKQAVDNRQPDGTFGPGNVANPYGRPKKGWTWRDLINDELLVQLQSKDGGPSIEARKAIVKRLVLMAVGGDIQAVRELFDRTEGKPIQPTAEVPDDLIKDLLHIYKPTKNPE